MTALKRTQTRARAFGIEAEIISPRECGEKYSHDGVELMRYDDLKGGLWLPGDGSGSPTDLTMSLAAGARQRGVSIREGVRVEKFLTANYAGGQQRKILGVETSAGTVTADVVVLCGGQWSRQLARSMGITVPLHSAEHFYLITEKIRGVHPWLPVMRDPDALTYFREWSGGILFGGFERTAKPIFSEGVPRDFAFSLLPDDWDQFAPLYTGAQERIPALEKAPIRQFLNGPESFTTDNAYILGEAPEMKGLFVAAGFNSSGIASAGGAGKSISEWIVNGVPTMDLWPVDIRRFGGFHANTAFLRERTKETLGLHYAMPWPRREFKAVRNLRLSPLYSRLAQSGAVFGQKFGWERPNYFAPCGASEEERKRLAKYTFARPAWAAQVEAEHRSTREGVTLFDLTSFSKFVVQGAHAEAAMQRLCGANVGVEPGRVVYTGMLNERGGYESDVTVTRVSEREYFVVCVLTCCDALGYPSRPLRNLTRI